MHPKCKAKLKVGIVKIHGKEESLRFSLREHQSYPDLYPNYVFSKDGGASKIRELSNNPSLGAGYIFIVCPRLWLNGKYIRWNWNGYYSGASDKTLATALIYDGEYDRSSDTDFPFGAAVPLKGNGLLQTLYTKVGKGSWGPETRDVQVNVSGGSQDKVTIFFKIHDSWAGQQIYLDIDWFEINTGSGGSGNLYDEQFTASVTMERTETYGDYGYISTGVIVGYTIAGVTRDAQGNPLGGCTVWMFKTSEKSFYGEQVSDELGNYSFEVYDTVSEYFIHAFKDGTPNVFGSTDRNLKGA